MKPRYKKLLKIYGKLSVAYSKETNLHKRIEIDLKLSRVAVLLLRCNSIKTTKA
jgi:hypothetical protein